MPLKIRDAANALRTGALIKIRDAGNVLRTAKLIKFRDAGNVLRTISGSLTLALNRTYVSGFVSTGGIPTVTTEAVSVTVTGGVSPFTASWAQVDVEPGWTITTPTSLSTTFKAPVSAGQTKEAYFACTVTDAAGISAVTSEVFASVSNFGGGMSPL